MYIIYEIYKEPSGSTISLKLYDVETLGVVLISERILSIPV